jgi:NAD(P)H-flavin reductase
VARYLAGVWPGDEVAFRGPKGRSMIPKDRTRDVVLVATGVALGPCLSAATYLLRDGFDGRIDLFWGLRSTDDLWAVDDLERLAAAHPNFRHHISLSQPPEDWTGLRGRVTETVTDRLPRLGGTQY